MVFTTLSMAIQNKRNKNGHGMLPDSKSFPSDFEYSVDVCLARCALEAGYDSNGLKVLPGSVEAFTNS
jgi:hypothetical protein